MAKKLLFLLVAVVLVLPLALASHYGVQPIYSFAGLCSSYCDGGIYYYHGKVTRDAGCDYSQVRCAKGCDDSARSCKAVPKKQLRLEVPSHLGAHFQEIRGRQFRDLAVRSCPDTCYDGSLYFEGQLNPSSGRCTYSWQPCKYGCNVAQAQCAASRGFVTRYPYQPTLSYGPYIQPPTPTQRIYAPYNIHTRQFNFLGMQATLKEN